MKYDVIIIGSGLGGLECAHIMARCGMRVLVLEQGTHAGGCMQSYRRGNMDFDTGFHYVGGLGEGESLYEAFRKLNLLHLPWYRMDENFDRINIDGKTYCFAQGFENFAITLAKDFPEERSGLEELATLLQNSSNKSISHNEFEMQAQVSALQYLHSIINNPLLIDILCTPASVKGEMCRASLPLFTFIHENSGCIESAWRLQGSGNMIVHSLLNDISSMGGSIMTKARVTELVVTDRRIIKAVCEDGRTFEADIFISDVHPASTVDMISSSLGIYGRRISSLKNTNGIFTVSLVLKPHSLKYFNWNQYLVEGNRTIMISCRVPEDDTDYSRQIDLLLPMPDVIIKRNREYGALKDSLADQFIAFAEQLIPHLGEMVAERYISTPLTYNKFTLTPNGSAFGIRKDFRNPMMTYLSPRTPIANLYLTGQSLMLHGVHGVTMTAFDTCKNIINK